MGAGNPQRLKCNAVLTKFPHKSLSCNVAGRSVRDRQHWMLFCRTVNLLLLSEPRCVNCQMILWRQRKLTTHRVTSSYHLYSILLLTTSNNSFCNFLYWWNKIFYFVRLLLFCVNKWYWRFSSLIAWVKLTEK